jgi:retinol dehydrogenase 14
MGAPTIVITGANAGVGYEVALGAAKRGAVVAMVCRDRERGEAAKARIEKAAPRAVVVLHIADLAKQGEVRRLASELDARHNRIDVLVNNAGLVALERRVTDDGVETTFAVNHLAPFLLTNVLLGKLRASAPSRVVVVASQVEARGRIRFDDLQLVSGFEPLEAYFQSKLANVMFTYELARRLEGSGVTVNCAHPGVLATNLLCDYMGRPRALSAANRLRHPGPAEGAKGILRLAFAPELAKTTGAYFHEGREAKSSAASHDRAAQERLWEASERLVAGSA